MRTPDPSPKTQQDVVRAGSVRGVQPRIRGDELVDTIEFGETLPTGTYRLVFETVIVPGDFDTYIDISIGVLLLAAQGRADIFDGCKPLKMGAIDKSHLSMSDVEKAMDGFFNRLLVD